MEQRIRFREGGTFSSLNADGGFAYGHDLAAILKYPINVTSSGGAIGSSIHVPGSVSCWESNTSDGSEMSRYQRQCYPKHARAVSKAFHRVNN